MCQNSRQDYQVLIMHAKIRIKLRVVSEIRGEFKGTV